MISSVIASSVGHGRGFARYVGTGTSTLPETVMTIGCHKNGQPVRIEISVRALVDDCGCISEIEGAAKPDVAALIRLPRRRERAALAAQ